MFNFEEELKKNNISLEEAEYVIDSLKEYISSDPYMSLEELQKSSILNIKTSRLVEELKLDRSTATDSLTDLLINDFN